MMMTTGKTKWYCVHCGFDLTKKTEDRFCVTRDGDLCEPKYRR